MSKLFPSPPSQMRFTQIEAEFRATKSPKHLPDPKSIDTRSCHFPQSQTLTQVAAARSTYPTLPRALATNPTLLLPPPPPKKKSFRPPLRCDPLGFADVGEMRSNAAPFKKSSSDRVWEDYDEGRFVQASDLINATAAVNEDIQGEFDDLPDDTSNNGFSSGSGRGPKDSAYEIPSRNCDSLSKSQQEGLERHPFSTRKSASIEDDQKDDGNSSPMSDFEEEIYHSLENREGEGEVKEKIRQLERNIPSYSIKEGEARLDDKAPIGNEFDQWLSDIESDLEKGYERDLPPSKSDKHGGFSFRKSADDGMRLSANLATSHAPCEFGDGHYNPSLRNRENSRVRNRDDIGVYRNQDPHPNGGRFFHGDQASSHPNARGVDEVGGPIRDHSSYRPTLSSTSSPKNEDSSDDLVPVAMIPSRFRSLFHFSKFNRVQSKVFSDSFQSSKSLVISAPTGSGKTVVFELALIRLLIASSSGSGEGRPFIAVYLAPTKALCNEKYEDWSRRFGSLNVFSCHLMTGDSEIDLGSPDFVQCVKSGQVSIVVSTPEKWDMMTRNWRENINSVRDLKLIMIDEVHHLGVSGRGPTLEAVVSRLKIIDRSSDVSSSRSSIRFVAVSATIPNIEDLAQWLGQDEPAIHHAFGSEFRPVKLRHVVLSYPDQDSKYLFDRNLSYKMNKIIQTYSEGKPSLVFCTTRKMAEFSAAEMVKDSRSSNRELEQISESQVESDKLRRLLPFGVAFHHAGLSLPDRKTVEALFLQNKLPNLFATSTLATGVNLPAHLVVLKSTFQYATAGYVELNENQVLQMIGRAGRPQFDKSATVVILTQHSTKSKYESLLGGKQLIESSFHKSLIENLNAEISLYSINSVDEAVFWLKSTFFFQRFMKDPEKYGFSIETSDPLKVDRELQKLCRTSVQSLANIGCVLMNDRFEVSPTGTGKLMAKYCIAYETMKMIYELKGDESMADLLMLLSNSVEFTDVALRQSEKSFLNRLSDKKNLDRIRFPLDSKVKTNSLKVYVVIQAALGGITFSDISLTQESLMIFKSAPRIAICLMEFLLSQRKDYKLCVHGVYLAKCIKARLWEDSRLTMKQLKGIGDKMAQMLVDAGYSDFGSIKKADPRNIEMVLNRAPPFGSHLIDRINRLPSYSLSVSTMDPIQSSKARLCLVISLTNKDEITIENSTTGRYHRCVLVVGDVDNNVVYQRRIHDSELVKAGKLVYEFQVDRSETSPELQIHYLSTEFIGLDVWIAVKPIYTDLNGSSGESSHGETSMTSEDHNVHLEKNKVTDRPSKKPAKRNVLGPCGHHCANKRICKHECCKVKEDDSTLKQQSISRFLKKRTVRGNEPGAGQPVTGKENACHQSESLSGNSTSPETKESGPPPSDQNETSASQKLSQKMSKFQFRPLQKVPPMIRDNQNETNLVRNSQLQRSSAHRFPPEMSDVTDRERENTATCRTVQSTFNHQRVPQKEFDSSCPSTAPWRPRLSEKMLERNDGNEIVTKPIDRISILSPKSCLKRSYPDQLANNSIRAKVSRAAPSVEAVRAWAISPMEDEILQLQRELEDLRRQQQEQIVSDTATGADQCPLNESLQQHIEQVVPDKVAEADDYSLDCWHKEQRPISETANEKSKYPFNQAALPLQELPFLPTCSDGVAACLNEPFPGSKDFQIRPKLFAPLGDMSLDRKGEMPSITYRGKPTQRKVDTISLLNDLDDF